MTGAVWDYLQMFGRGLTPLMRALIIVMSLLATGLIAYAAKSGTPLQYADERQYLDIARSVSNGQGFALDGSPTAYRPPVWPAVLAVFLMLGLPESLLSLVPAASMIAAAAAAAVVGMRLSRNPYGALAGVAILLYPLNVYTAVTLYPQALATLFVVLLWLFAYLVSESAGRPRAFLYIISGLVASLLSLAVPTMAFTGFVVICWIVFTARGDRVRAATYSIAALVLPVAAWTLRNVLVLGAPILLSTSGGLNLLIGNNPSATGSSGVNVDIGSLRGADNMMNETEADQHLRGVAVDWIVGHPAESFALYVAKVFNYFAPYNEPVTASQGTNLQRIVAYTCFTVVLLLLVARLLFRQRLPIHPTERLFIALFIANSFVMAVFFTRTRFRQPLDSILLIEASVACAMLIYFFTVRRRERKSDNLAEALSRTETTRGSGADAG